MLILGLLPVSVGVAAELGCGPRVAPSSAPHPAGPHFIQGLFAYLGFTPIPGTQATYWQDLLIKVSDTGVDDIEINFLNGARKDIGSLSLSPERTIRTPDRTQVLAGYSLDMNFTGLYSDRRVGIVALLLAAVHLRGRNGESFHSPRSMSKDDQQAWEELERVQLAHRIQGSIWDDVTNAPAPIQVFELTGQNLPADSLEALKDFYSKRRTP